MEISKRVLKCLPFGATYTFWLVFTGHTITIKISRSIFRRRYVILLRKPPFSLVFDRLSTLAWVGGRWRGESQRFKISALCAFPVLRSQRYNQKKGKNPSVWAL